MATKTKAKAEALGTPVLVTTDKKGVFFGYTDDYSGDVITLKQARNCVKWTASIKGVFGLAASGPDRECRIGPAVPSMQLRGITSVCETTPAAVEAWEKAPWS